MSAPAPNNLKGVIEDCVKLGTESWKFIIRSKDEVGGPELTAAHYFRGYSLRIKNPNGIARNMPGLMASLENFGNHDGILSLIIVKLDEDHQISIWKSITGEIVGCMIGVEGGGTPNLIGG
jgi:hypothetical protein